MTESETSRFDDITTVVRDPLHFKYKLDIGEDAYQSLRLKKYLLDAVDAGNGAIVGFGAAKSSLVASTFFAPSGLLGAIGVGTAATPLGWAIAAGAVGAGLSLVIGKHLIRSSSTQVRGVPDCVNTPMDILAIGLFDLIAMLAVKLALADEDFDPREREKIRRYFIDDWGYDETFVDAGLEEIERVAAEYKIREVAEQLARFKKENPDCNYATMSEEIIGFLKQLSEVDGVVVEREASAIDEVRFIFEEVNRSIVSVVVSETLETVTDVGSRTAENVGAAVSKVGTVAKETKDSISKKLERKSDDDN